MGTALKKYDLSGKELGEIAIDADLSEGLSNLQMIKDYLIALRANERQWSANTQVRSEVNHSGKKPHPQKGTGRARQGYLGSPQYRGGGRVFGPRPKPGLERVRINKKEKRAAIRHLLSEKIVQQRLFVLSMPELKSPKTQQFAHFLKQLNLTGQRVLFISEEMIQPKRAAKTTKSKGKKSAGVDVHQNLLKSLRNIPKIKATPVQCINGYDLAVNQNLIVLEPVVQKLLAIIGR